MSKDNRQFLALVVIAVCLSLSLSWWGVPITGALAYLHYSKD